MPFLGQPEIASAWFHFVGQGTGTAARASVTLIYAFTTNRTRRSRQSIRARPMADREDRRYAARSPLHPRRSLYSQSLDLVTALTQATFSRDKSRALETASDRVNSLRILLRLAKDIRLLSFAPYTYATGLLDEIGRMIGGWRKSQ